MNSTKVAEIVQKVREEIFTQLPMVASISADIQAFSPQAHILLVGGAVRDAFMGIETQDFDIEVYGVPLHDLEKILKQYGVIRKVGKVFGVLKIDGVPVDWALPRTDSSGRKPDVVSDPFLSYEKAFIRRDVTINAMGIDLITGVLIDPYDGLVDLEKKQLRVVDPVFFQEDPLRYFRIMQFMGRFQFIPDTQLYEIGRTMPLEEISHERIAQEFYKLFNQGIKPSLGLDWLLNTGRLKTYMPEVFALCGVEQNPKWHPEGDVFEHTKQAVDGAALETYNSDEDRYVMILTALCHDLGKATTTRFEDGRIRSKGHDLAGVALAQSLLDRMEVAKHFHPRITKLVRWHMTPYSLVENNAGAAAYKRLAYRLAPHTCLYELIRLVRIDKGARNPEKTGLIALDNDEVFQTFIKKVTEYELLYGPVKPLLQGEDLKQFIKPGPEMGKLLEQAYELQMEENIDDKEQLIDLLQKKNILKKA